MCSRLGSGGVGLWKAGLEARLSGNLLTDACKVISFVTSATSLAWCWAYVTVVLPLGDMEKAKSVRVGSRSWSARRFFDQFVRCRGSGRVNFFFCGRISQKLLCMLRRLKRYNLIHHESRGERGILRFPLAISVKYVFSEATEGFVETEEKLTPNKFFRVHAKRSSPGGSTYSGFLRWNAGLVCLWHFCSEVVAVLHQTSCTSVVFFDFLMPNPVFSSVIVRYPGNCVRYPIQLQELLTRRVSQRRCSGPQSWWVCF